MTSTLNEELDRFLLAYFDEDFTVGPEFQLDSTAFQHLKNDDFIEVLSNVTDWSFLENIDNIKRETSKNANTFVEYISIAISSVLLFVRANWTGPDFNNTISIPVSLDAVKKELTADGEELNENVKDPEFLYVAKIIFTNICSNISPMLINIWRMRLLYLQQACIDELCVTFYEEFNEIYETFRSVLNFCPRLSIEVSRYLLKYGKVQEASELLEDTKQVLEVKLEFVGDLGKRTRYQQESLPQVRFHVNHTEQQILKEEENLPEIVALNDDVRLDFIQWDTESDKFIPLNSLKQSLLLAEVAYRQKSQPQDNLSNEEILPIIDYILQQKNTWCARLIALYTKCRSEVSNKRTIERALTQYELLIATINTSPASFHQRMKNFWLLAPLPKWRLEARMAETLLAVGLVKAALDLCLKLRLWEDVIVCYTILNMRHKAAEIIQQELGKKPTVKLLCLLGDATDNAGYYEEANTLAKGKSARPPRHWGQYLFAKKEYAASIPHFQRSLEINSLQTMVWVRLGYAALSVEQWDVAAQAYRRYTTLEPSSFEAWNNLARIYIAQGDKKRAHAALTEALKTSYDNWQVWDNFMVTSIDIGAFSDVIRAYHRLLDLREKHLDVEVLTILTNSVAENVSDNEGKSSQRLLPKCLELLGRVTAVHPNEAKVWNLYAQITEDPYLRVQRLQRVHRAFVQDTKWPKDLDKCERVVKNCLIMGESCRLVNDAALKSAVRLSLKSAARIVAREDWEQLTDSVNRLETIADELCTTTTSSNNSC